MKFRLSLLKEYLQLLTPSALYLLVGYHFFGVKSIRKSSEELSLSSGTIFTAKKELTKLGFLQWSQKEERYILSEPKGKPKKSIQRKREKESSSSLQDTYSNYSIYIAVSKLLIDTNNYKGTVPRMNGRINKQLGVLVEKEVDKHVGSLVKWFFKEKAGRLNFNFGILCKPDMVDEFIEANKELFRKNRFEERSRQELIKAGKRLESALKRGEKLTKTQKGILEDYRKTKK